MIQKRDPSMLHLVRGAESFPTDAETQRFIDSLGNLPQDLESFRAVLTGLQLPPADDFEVETVFANPVIEPPSNKQFRIIRPIRPNGKLPLLCYFHGGGWSKDAHHSHDRWLQQLASETNMAIASLDDDRRQNETVSTQVQRALAQIGWLKDNADNFNVDPQNLAVAGDSLAASLALTVCLALSRRQSWHAKALVLICPLIIGTTETPSRIQFATGPWLTTDVVDEMLSFSTAGPLDQSEPQHSLGAVRQLVSAPPTTIITAEYDPLRDEGEDCARALMKAGVLASAIRHVGTIHNFVILDLLTDSASSKTALKQIAQALRA